MVIRPGHWVGKGSLLLQGRSLGQTLALDVVVKDDDDGLSVEGDMRIDDGEAVTVSVRMVPNEVGTYTLDAFVAGTRLDGVGKLESEPLLGLLWHESRIVEVSAAVFAVSAGVGCRGFARDDKAVYTWEIAFTRKQDQVRGGNVVSLSKRRR